MRDPLATQMFGAALTRKTREAARQSRRAALPKLRARRLGAGFAVTGRVPTSNVRPTASTKTWCEMHLLACDGVAYPLGCDRAATRRTETRSPTAKAKERKTITAGPND